MTYRQELLDQLRRLDHRCRAAARPGYDGVPVFYDHMLVHRSPPGVTGSPLYLVDGRWLVRDPDDRRRGQSYATVADYLSTWWSPYDSASKTLRAVLNVPRDETGDYASLGPFIEAALAECGA